MRKGLPRARRSTALLCTTVGVGLALAAPSQAETIYAVTATPVPNENTLITFDSATPNATTTIGPVDVAAGEIVRGIDFRPATGQLYAIASTGTAPSFSNRVYTINKAGGAATQVGAATFTTTGAVSGVDFNPVPGALRVVTEDEESFRVNPITGAATAEAAKLAPANKIVGAAYTNNAAGANNTTLYGIDANDSGAPENPTDNLVRIGGPGGAPSPNGGQVNFVAPLRDPAGSPVDITDTEPASFDVSGQTGTAFLAARFNSRYRLVRVYLDNLPTIGGTPSFNMIGSGLDTVRGIAIELPPGSVQFASSTFGTSETGPTAAVTVTRTGNSDAQATVNYATTNGTAVAGEDYTAATGTLTFSPGENVKTFTIPVTDDDVVEPTETINVALSGVAPADGASLGAPNATVVGLFDNDETPPATPQPEPQPTPDTMRPRVLVSAPDFLTYTQARSRKGLAVQASCSEACVFAAELRVGTKLLGTRSASTSSASVASLPIRFSAAGRRELGRRLPKPRRGARPRSIRITLRVSATDAAGLTTVRNRFIRIAR